MLWVYPYHNQSACCRQCRCDLFVCWSSNDVTECIHYKQQELQVSRGLCEGLQDFWLKQRGC
jgi:hypothetical protein